VRGIPSWGTLEFVAKASLQVLKTAVSFAAGTVVTFCAFYGLVVLPHILQHNLLVGLCSERVQLAPLMPRRTEVERG
jgi:hypothetical protein